MELGVIGLGRMGQIVVNRSLDAGHDVVAFDLSAEATATAAEAGATAADSVEDLCDRLGADKRIWLMVPAGDAVDATLADLEPHLDADDVEDRVPLHIKANETSLEQIISTIAEPLGIDPEVDQVTELDAGSLARGIVESIRANPGSTLRDVDLQPLLDPNQGDLESLLESNIENYQRGLEESDETEFDPNLISNDDYRDLSLQLGTDSVFHENKQVLRKALRDEIHRHFSHLIGVDDFQGQLREYSQRIVDEEEKRPVIICEDVTTFSVLKEQLLDQIIQVESATYDIVLGYTTGFEQDDLQDALGSRGSDDPLTYLKDRAEGYLSLTENGQATFLDDAPSVELVRKYLDVIKAESGGGIDEELEAGFDGLYPFNKPFIRRVYENLQEDGEPRQTPRVLLQKVVRRCLLSDDPPFEVVEKSPSVDDVVPTINPATYSDRAQRVATWYGAQAEDSDRVHVPTTILRTFDVAAESDATIEIDGAKQGLFEANSAVQKFLAPMVEESGSTDSEDGASTTGDEDDESQSKDDESEGADDEQSQSTQSTGTSPSQEGSGGGDRDRTEKQLKEFYEWVSTGDRYDSSDVLQSGAEDLLNMWYDPTRLANPNASTSATKGIYYTRGKDVPVSIQGPDERQGLDVLVPFGDEHIDLYTDILQVGMHGDLSDGMNAERLRSWTTDQVVSFRHDIRDAVEACLPPELTIEHTILLAKYLLLNAEFGRTEFDEAAVFAEIDLDNREYENPITDALGRNHALNEALDDLYSRKGDIQGLIDGFFLLKSNLVDYERLTPSRQEIADDPEQYLEFAKAIETEELDYPSAFEIGNTRNKANIKVTTFLNAVSDFAVELERLDDEDLTDHFETNLEPVETWYDPSHTAGELTDLFERLNECMGTFEETRKEQWDTVYQTMTDEDVNLKLTEFEQSVDDFLDPDPDSPFERVAILHSFAKSQREHHAWDIYMTFDEIVQVLDDHEVEESTDLTERFRQLDGLDTYESARSDVHSALESY